MQIQSNTQVEMKIIIATLEKFVKWIWSFNLEISVGQMTQSSPTVDIGRFSEMK